MSRKIAANTTATAQAAQSTVDKVRAEWKAGRAAAKGEPEVLEPLAAPVDEASTLEQLANDAQAAFDKFMEKLGAASPKRYLCSAIISLCAAGGLGYVLGQVITAMATGVALLTSSAFLTWIALVLGSVVTVWLSAKAAGAVFDYVVTKKVDAHWQMAKSSVLSLFKRDAAPITE